MKKNVISNLLLVFSLIALIIAIYQLADLRTLDGILSRFFPQFF